MSDCKLEMQILVNQLSPSFIPQFYHSSATEVKLKLATNLVTKV